MNNHNNMKASGLTYTVERCLFRHAVFGEVVVIEDVRVYPETGARVAYPAGTMPRSALLQAFPGGFVNKLIYDGEPVTVWPETVLEDIVALFLEDVRIDVIEDSEDAIFEGLDSHLERGNC